VLRILVTNIKGGCGKTTIATSLAGAFAVSGFETALADVDRQHSSLDWLRLRPAAAPAISGLDWRKQPGEVPNSTRRLVIDAPANLKMKEVGELIASADLVVVPVLPSLFDEGSTERFLNRLAELKPIRKGRKDVVVVANRLRPRTRAAQRLEAFLAGRGEEPVARLADRSVYAEVAIQGLSVFDLRGRQIEPVREEWRPLLRAAEGLAPAH
jgi:chromosome partitioning protein